MPTTVIALLHACVLATTVSAQQRDPELARLKALSLEELTRVEVTTVARRPEAVQRAAAAVTVLTRDDVVRSGHLQLADVLRLADGVHVGRFDSSTWGVSARGFNGNTANKMLVMIDGRSIYSPFNSGIFWETADTFLQDVDRIDVVRGPGGSLWGANAMNGVINIVTTTARDAQGTLAYLGAGNEEWGFAGVRHGGQLARNAFYRAYAKYSYRDGQVLATGDDLNDPLRRGQVGFRTDWHRNSTDVLTVQGDLYSGRAGIRARPATPIAGGNLLARYSFGGVTARSQLQGYYERSERHAWNLLGETRDTVDVDLQHERALGPHQLVVGGGYRRTRDEADANVNVFFDPMSRSVDVLNAFAQADIRLADTVTAIIGAKAERNDYTGWEPQPTARLRWRPQEASTVWGAVSRAIRMPTRFDSDLRLTGRTGQVTVTGSDTFRAETLLAYEVGLRHRLARWLTLDVTGFHHVYDDLRSQERPLVPGEPVVLANTLGATVSGVELSTVAQVLQGSRVHVSYTDWNHGVRRDPSSRSLTTVEGDDPEYFWHVRSVNDLPGRIQLDGMLRRVGRLRLSRVEPYTELDVRFAWRLRPRAEISVTGHDLLHPAHAEFVGNQPVRQLYQRSAFVQLTLFR